MTPVEAWQAALAAEHAAVHLLGSLGARTSESATPLLAQRLREAWTAHRERRDEVAALVRGLGEAPVGSAAAYDVPSTAGPQRVRDAAVAVEYACADTYGVVVASTTGAQRRRAARALTECAVAVLALDGDARPLPGLPAG